MITFVLWATMLLAGTKAPAPRPAYTLQQYAGIRRANDPSLSSDGDRMVFASNASGDWQLWVTPTARWQPKQLTHLPGGAIGRWSPTGPVVLAMADHNGDQKFQLFTIDAASGDTTLLTPEPEASHRLGGWMPDGRSIFYVSNARDARYFDCYVMDLQTRHAERVFERPALLRAVAVSHDGRLLAVEDVHSNVDNDVWIVDIAARTGRPVAAHQGDAQFAIIGFSSDDRTLYCRTDVGSEFLRIAAIDLPSGARRDVVTSSHDIDFAVLNRQGTQMAFSENVDGYERLGLWDLRSGRRRPLPAVPPGIDTPQAFSADGSKLAIVVSTPVHDDEAWLIDLARHRASRATWSPQGGIAENSYALPRIIHYPSFDGRSIPALLFVPRGASPRHRAPVIISVHGGPEGQEQPYLTSDYQYLVARGYAVLAPNIRGSTGYGKSYVALDNGPLRWKALDDVAHAVRWIARQPGLDGANVACWGASYGGFTTLAMLVHYPELLRAGVDFYGPVDLQTFLARTAPHRRLQRIAEYGDPVRDSTFMAEISPARHADRIKRPLLVVQGANDPIVPPAESEDIVRQVKAHGGVADYLLVPDEGHGFGKTEHRVQALETMLAFLRRYMPPR